MVILGIVRSLIPSTANLPLILIPINVAKIALNRIYEFNFIEKEEGQIITEINSIVIQNLSFQFVGSSELFTNINFNIEKEKLTAIVGESVSGKCTYSANFTTFFLL